MGPGKAELLEHIQETGSLLLAAQKMKASYMRAWTMVKTMNSCFEEPLVQLARGGKEGGGASLTQTGLKVLRCYRQIETNALDAAKTDWLKIKALLKS